MNEITSLQNQTIKEIMRLHGAKGRQKQQQFIAEGARTISALLQANNYPLCQLYCTQETEAQARALLTQPAHYNKLTRVLPHVMEKISTTTTASGILGVFTHGFPAHAAQLSSGIVLANITDPGNMGTLMRTCAALGNRSIVVIEGTDPFGPKVIQASAGTIAQLTIFQWTWEELIAHKGTKALCALVVSGGQSPEEIQADPTSNSMLLVVGNEAHGIPNDWIAQCELRMSLPMPGNTESLNAAVAGSIALYLSQKTIK